MATYTMYAPFNGTVSGLNCYCNNRHTPCSTPCNGTGTKCKDIINCQTCSSPCGCSTCCQHNVVPSGEYFCCPLDIAGNESMSIFAEIGSNLLSVKIIHRDICTSCCTGDRAKGTDLEVYTGYSGGGVRLGSLMYGHLANRQHANGTIINKPAGFNTWAAYIGKIPGGSDPCYSGPHTHLNIRS
jgi:hypothetical protein